MYEILNNIYLARLLLVAFVKYILSQIYGHVFGTVLLDTFWKLWKLLFFEQKTFKIVVYLFFLSRNQQLPNSGIFGRRKLPNLSMNNIFNVLLIVLQYTISFKWPDVSLKCYVTITVKGQSIKFKASVLYGIFPFLK